MVAILLTFAVALPLANAAQQQGPPDPALGHIDGRQAVLFWPADGQVSDCRATLVPEADPDREIQYPCGEWFVPPFGRYEVWIEGSALISAAPTRLAYVSSRFDGKGLLVVAERTAAGEVALLTAWPGASLRLLDIDSFASGGVVGPAFDRRAKGDRVDPVRMPAGRVLAGLFDSRSNDAIALARPVHVPAGGRASVAPLPPARGTDVLVVLDRPRVRDQADSEVVTLQLEIDGASKRPDVLADSADRVYAVWYGVEGRRGRVAAAGRELTFPAQEFRLRPRQVVTVRGHLRPLPKLRVEIAPEALSYLPRDTRLMAQRLSGETLVDVPLDEAVVELGHLPAEPIDIVLLSPDIELRQRADLSRGIDETIRFATRVLTSRRQGRSGRRHVHACDAKTDRRDNQQRRRLHRPAVGHWRLSDRRIDARYPALRRWCSTAHERHRAEHRDPSREPDRRSSRRQDTERRARRQSRCHTAHWRVRARPRSSASRDR